MKPSRHTVERGLDLLAGAVRGTIDVARAGGGYVANRLLGQEPGVGRTPPAPPQPQRPPATTPTAQAPPPSEPPPPSGAEAAAAARSEAPAWTPAETAPEPPPPAPAEHVSEETGMVGEFAEEGAEGGAGPEVAVGEPWEGYEGMRAREITERLRTASGNLAAAVRLYESQHKNRKSVLDASERAQRR